MNEAILSERMSVYEISYLIATSVPEEKVPAEAEAVKKIVTDSGAAVIAEEAPHKETLAYEMRRKTVSGAYEKYDEAYFGWIKFEVGSDKIEAVKKAFEVHPSVLRMLLISTVAENTYLGKRASAVAASFAANKSDGVGAKVEDRREEKKEVKKEVTAPASIAEMDKSIDALVKEV